MGIFEKSIPRYVYNPIQRQPEVVPEYYVDDIFDPILNKNVRAALTQKYGNPLLGTVMGYYEGVENALFGQNDKWGILGPGMGILSGFGRSMDKAGDVILGSLTEGVKGVTGQGFENPLENVFVEDQDYTGRRALAAIGNSMSRFVGGTELTEEDFGGEFGPVALGIELTTDPSILGGNLTKIAKKPSIAKQLGSANNFLGNVGSFLQKYDDIMAKASIDLTAPGLRPAIKALRESWHKILPGNFGAKYTDAYRTIYNTDTSDPTSVAASQQLQKELAEDETLAAVSEMDSKLAELEDLIDSETVRSFGDTYDGGYGELTNVPVPRDTSAEHEKLAAMQRDFEDASTMYEIAPNLTEDEILDAEVAHKAMALPRSKLRSAINDYRKVVGTDLSKLAEYDQAVAEDLTSKLDLLNTAIAKRDEDFHIAADDFIHYVMDRGGNVNILTNPFDNDKVYDAYTNFIKTYLDLPEGTRIDLDEYENTLHDAGFEEYMRSVLSYVIDEANPEYSYRVKFDPTAWRLSAFSENEALNKAIISALENDFPKFSTPSSGVTLSPSQMGKLSEQILSTGNAYADTALSNVMVRATGRKLFPATDDAASFVKSFKKPEIDEAFKTFVPNKNARKDILDRLTRIYYPPKEVVNSYGKSVPYDQYLRYKDYEELATLLRTKGKLNRLDDVAFGKDLLELKTPDELATIAHAPWTLLEPEKYLQNISPIRSKLNVIGSKDAALLAKQYSEAFEYYTLGRGRKVTERGLREKFGTVFDDKVLKILESDVAEYRKMLDTIRHSILSNSSSSEAVFFKDLEKALDDVDRNYLQPANLGAAERAFDRSGTKPKSSNASIESPYYSAYAFDRGTFWTLRQIIDRNPQIFKNFANVVDAADILSNFAQFKVLDDSFEFTKRVKHAGVVDNTLPSADVFLKKFKNEVLPLAQQAVEKGYTPIPSKSTADYFPELAKLVGTDSRSSRAYRQMLNDLTDWKFIDAISPKGKPYKKFVGTVHAERFNLDAYSKHEFMNAALRQPKFEFADARADMLFSSANAMADAPNAPFATYSEGLAEHFTEVKLPKTQTYSTKALSKANYITEVEPKQAAVLAYTPITPAEVAQRKVLNELTVTPAGQDALSSRLKSVWDKYHLEKTPAQPESVAEAPNKVWHWFEQVRKAIATPLRAAGLLSDEKTGERIGRATLRTKRAEDVILKARKLVSDGVTQSDVRKTLGLLTAQQGDVLKGANFVDEICKEGMVRSAFRTKSAATTAKSMLEANVNTFNAAVGHDVLSTVERKMTNGNYEVIVMFNTKNKKLVRQIANAKKLSNAKFVDVEFLKAHHLTEEQQAFLRSEPAQKVMAFLGDVDEIAKDQARVLGFNFDDSLHAKHVRDVNPETANYVANDLNNGIDLDSLEEASTLLANTDTFRTRFKGALGSRLRGRRYRGAYWNYDTATSSLFTYDLEKLAKGSLGDGMFANSNYQSFVDLFVNDNFKINGIFEDVDDIRKFLYQGGSEGRWAGNLKNVDLCYAKYDADGRFVGIHKYNVYSDADLEKALSNPDTILVPANVVDTIDKVIRKEIRLSNKAYAFINKHFTIPFKFGVLTNPGFLVGNISDAYMKQAVSMSEKYGTDVSSELAKVGEAATMYLNLGNAYNKAIEKWQSDMRALGFELTAAEEIPEILAGHAASRQRLTEYVNGTLKDANGNLVTGALTSDEVGTILLWTKLQQLQHTSNSLREFDDVADAIGTSEFDVPRSLIDRITQGSGKYSISKPSTWGVFVNNPVTNSAMKASEFIESTMRGTAVLNDLMHEGYTNDQIFKILLDGNVTPEAAATKLAFDVDFADAVNAMYESNFNYERMSDFMEGVGKAMPFPTFFLKNLTYWLTLFEKNPQFFDHAITVHENMWAGRDTSEDEFVAEAKGRGAVPVGQKMSKFFKGIYKPTPLQSMFGAFNLVNEPIENLSYRLHPLISGSAQAANQALPHNPLTTLLGEAKYRPYSTDIYERNVTQDDENFNPLSYAMHRSNPFERAVNTALRTPAKVREGQAQLSDFLPSIFQPDFSKK